MDYQQIHHIKTIYRDTVDVDNTIGKAGEAKKMCEIILRVDDKKKEKRKSFSSFSYTISISTAFLLHAWACFFIFFLSSSSLPLLYSKWKMI